MLGLDDVVDWEWLLIGRLYELIRSWDEPNLRKHCWIAEVIRPNKFTTHQDSIRSWQDKEGAANTTIREGHFAHAQAHGWRIKKSGKEVKVFWQRNKLNSSLDEC